MCSLSPSLKQFQIYIEEILLVYTHFSPSVKILFYIKLLCGTHTKKKVGATVDYLTNKNQKQRWLLNMIAFVTDTDFSGASLKDVPD